MIVKYISIDNKEVFLPSVIGLGNFDGVHKGHQKLMKKCIELASNLHIQSSILTFDTPIDKILYKDFKGEITPLKQKIELIEKVGIDVCYVLKFDQEVAGKLPLDFINLLTSLNIKSIVVGDDYRFGKFGQGDVNLLKEYFDVNIIKYAMSDNGNKISSSTIISMIQEGSVELVKPYLTRNYFIDGAVVKGLGNGHKLGFPTANISYDGFVLPKYGVYEIKILIENKMYHGLCNVGVHPSIDKLEIPSIEVNIADFNRDIYDINVRLFFIKFIRNELKFDSVENLKNRINLDTFLNF